MRVSLLQLNFQVGDLVQNAEKIFQAAQTAAKDQPDLIVTSELALVGYPPKDLLLNQSFIADVEQEILALAAKMKDLPPLLLGAPERNLGTGKNLYNSCYLLREGKVQGSFQKTLLPNYDVFDEARWFESVSTPQSFSLGGKLIGVTICEDIWADFPFAGESYQKNPMEELKKEQVDLVVNLSSSPFALGKHQTRLGMLAGLAKKSQVPIVYSNQVGGNDELVFDGGSLVVGAGGEILTQLPRFAEGIATIDFSGQAQAEQTTLEAEEEVYEALVLGVRDYIGKCGFKKVVLGLSGGIDSAITAAIAAAALGP